MIYFLFILFGSWNGFEIREDLNNSRRSNTIWHKIGVFQKLGIGSIGIVVLLPQSYWWIINPFVLLPFWYGLIETILLSVLLCYWGYNYLINLIMGWEWNYLGHGKTGGMWYVGSLLITAMAFIVTLMIYFFGQYHTP